MSQEPDDQSEIALDRMVAPVLAGRVLAPPGTGYVVAEWRDPGAPPGPPRLIAPLHVHYEDDEAWYILDGTLQFRLGAREVEASAGAAIFAPRGVPHTFWNPRPEPARYLLIMTPNILRLIEGLHALPDRNPAAVEAVYRQHGSRILG